MTLDQVSRKAGESREIRDWAVRDQGRLSESWVSPVGALELQDLEVCQGKQKRRISQAKMELSAWKAVTWGWDTCLGHPFSQDPIGI